MESTLVAAVPNRAPYFPALTGLRAVSALMVFFFHVGIHVQALPLPRLLRWTVWLMQQLNIGVTIFFVLSGFLITNRYLNSVEVSKTWMKRYLQNRFARVYPLYFLLSVLTFGLMVVHPTYDWDEWPITYGFLDKVVAIVLNISLTRAYLQEMVYMGVGTAWSLTIEESFYLCAPVLMLGLKMSMRRLGIYPAILFIIGLMLVWVCSHLALPYGLMGSIDFMLTFTFFGRALEFFAGMGLAIWLARNREPLLPRAGRATWLGSIGIGLCTVALAVMAQVLPEKTSDGLRISWLIYNILLPLPIIGLFYGLINEQTWLRRLLQTPAFDLLGRSSYAFYLIHISIINDYFSAYVSHNWLARLIGMTLLSIALYKWVEEPLHKVLRSSPRRAPKPAFASLALD